MNLLEIIQTYFKITKAGGKEAADEYLRLLVKGADMDPNLVKHIKGCLTNPMGGKLHYLSVGWR